ncbi:Unknown protein sequence [Pseudomonas amygdali pv. lachrymans]|uniref:Uncharacterized protein n=1 Tax=Pseudomonas amygdali pv. lachrymans TaxID=53707 RepID=A0ABR5KSK9_PSEAV|nr:Unknown protein sequence [Pseudomonas amygdali pv. lachrymans]
MHARGRWILDQPCHAYKARLIIKYIALASLTNGHELDLSPPGHNVIDKCLSGLGQGVVALDS